MKCIRTLLQLTVFVQLISALVVGAEAKDNFGVGSIKVTSPSSHVITSTKNNFGV